MKKRMLHPYYFKILFVNLVFMVGFSESIFSQVHVLPMDRDKLLWYESELVNQNDSLHASIYPRCVVDFPNYQSVNQSFNKDNVEKWKHFLFNEYPLSFASNKVQLYPIINWQESVTKKGKRPFNQSIGIATRVNFTRNWSAGVDVYVVRQSLNMFEQARLDSTGYINEGVKVDAFEKSVHRFLGWSGYVAYQAGRYFRFQVGKGTHFLGQGYRSLWLSDHACSYPYAKVSAHIGKIQYLVLYQFLKDVDIEQINAPEVRKYAATHLLSWNIGKRINLNLFETVVWSDKLDNGSKRGFDFNYWNPIVFYRPVEYSLGSADNILMGAGGSLRVFKNTHLYGQILVDEFSLSELLARSGSWFNKFGYQAGVKSYNVLNIQNLFVRIEFNRVRPFTYTHRTILTNYGHMFRPLAHPFGANLNECIAVANYRKGRWQFHAQASLTVFGTDQDSLNMGQNIYRLYQDNRKENGNFVLQGRLNKLADMQLKVSYIINPLYYLRVEGGIRYTRWASGGNIYKQPLFFIGVRTQLL